MTRIAWQADIEPRTGNPDTDVSRSLNDPAASLLDRDFAEGSEPRRAPGYGAGRINSPGLLIMQAARTHHGHDTDKQIVKEPASRHAGILNP